MIEFKCLICGIHFVNNSLKSTHQKVKFCQTVFLSDKTLDVQFKRWQKKFIKALHASFRIVRVTNNERKMTYIDLLMKQKKELLENKHIDKEGKIKIDALDVQITKACEDREWDKLVNVLGKLDTDSGDTNNTNV